MKLANSSWVANNQHLTVFRACPTL